MVRTRRAGTVAVAALLAAAIAMPGPLDRPDAGAAFAATKAERRKAREERERREAKEARERRAATPQSADPKAAPAPPATAEPETAETSPAVPPLPPERVEADVSTRSVAVTSAFRGSEIVVFGSVDNSRQPSPESGYYDVVVVVEGQPAPLTVRRKGVVAGMWINMAAIAFEAVPTYYAVATTRPMEEIADADLLRDLSIGFENARLRVREDVLKASVASEVRDFERAIMRLKEDEGLFVREDTGVAFIGKSLFRSSIELPANIPVGSLTARVYLFREGALLSRYTTRVGLERKGLELVLYDFAHARSFLYGILAVAVAFAFGYAASALFNRSRV